MGRLITLFIHVLVPILILVPSRVHHLFGDVVSKACAVLNTTVLDEVNLTVFIVRWDIYQHCKLFRRFISCEVNDFFSTNGTTIFLAIPFAPEMILS